MIVASVSRCASTKSLPVKNSRNLLLGEAAIPPLLLSELKIAGKFGRWRGRRVWRLVDGARRRRSLGSGFGSGGSWTGIVVASLVW
jgi:hypothetical protein